MKNSDWDIEVEYQMQETIPDYKVLLTFNTDSYGQAFRDWLRAEGMAKFALWYEEWEFQYQ